MRKLFLLLIALTATATAQPFYILDSLEADLDGDGTLERAVLVSPSSPDPSHRTSKKELRIMKRKKDQYATLYTMPIEASFNTDLEGWQLESPEVLLWGLNLRKGKPYNVLTVVFTSSSGEFFDLVWNGKTYQVRSSGD
ncbi:MAG: hypothetical protein HY319_03770 [Armatimonadetes bacterium]|nr:hypothetical protein [Armatimonadota bacterium]